ncbi:MAG: hypothetical protein QG580_426 [Patescibacteria group bacterium]|nr:hypothetical protein [Patescibacteria group bacterium]
MLCSEPGSNWRPFPLQGNALPTELSERWYVANKSRYKNDNTEILNENREIINPRKEDYFSPLRSFVFAP